MSYFIDMYKNYVNFSGRATRKQFWCAYGIYIAVYAVLYVLAIVAGGLTFSATGTDMSAVNAFGLIVMGLIAIYVIGSLLPVIAIQIRRLRDAGFPWWAWLLCMIGSCLCGIGSIVLIILLCLPSKNVENEM